jgi:hypothetical protein
MTRKAVFALIFVLVVAVATVFLTAPGQHVQAQQNCPSFHGIIQARFPLEPPLPLRDGDGWGGNIYGFLDDEPLVGVFSGNDGSVSWHQWVGMGKGGTYKFAFGPIADNNTFTIIATQATFPNPPGKFFAGGTYQAGWKIAEGTGRFQNASGNLHANGPYLVSTTDGWVTVFGRWNAEVTGSICGVQ